jgi:Guanine nucleotide exchange factor synembryn
VYGRDPTNADPIFTKEVGHTRINRPLLAPIIFIFGPHTTNTVILKGIETLAWHAFNSPSQNTSLNALRCLANALLLRPETRQIFVDLGYMPKACAKLKIDSRDIEFVLSRIIFLTTYDTKMDIVELIDKENLAEYICLNISRHGEQFSMTPNKSKDPMSDMALTETLKLLFNISHFCPEKAGEFSPALHHILLIISKLSISTLNPLENPVAPLVNALVNMDLDSSDNNSTLFPKSAPSTYLNCLIDVLGKASKGYKDAELEQLVSPLLTVLRKMYEVAPADIQGQMRKVILPSTADREQPLGRAETLPSRLLRQSTNPATPQLRETISSLLFDMSGRDARRFVQNVGYGFASGFLFQHGIPIPENALDAWSNGTETASSDNQKIERDINPVTGQFMDREEKVEINMTQEEKEREAERLFVLFER